MAARTPMTLSVIDKRRLSLNMIRLTLGGEALRDFPEQCAGSYIKLLLPSPTDQPYVRTYTIRHFRRARAEIDVDFVVHQGQAPASNWAEACKVGDRVDIVGPGPGKMINEQAEWYFLAADMTALPALSANLERLPARARGYAVIEIAALEEREALSALLTLPSNVQAHWVCNPHPGQEDSPLLTAVRALPWLEGKAHVWAACEFKAMRGLRQYFKQERQIARQDIYISSYWKQGCSEDQHKREKRADEEQHLQETQAP